MALSEEFDVFISYRRTDGGTVARMLNNILSARGFKCFLDDAKIGVEDYADRIRSALEKSANFVAIITPAYFEAERINNPEDWVRQEIEIALSRKGEMNLVPLFVNGMYKAFPPNLPASIDRMRNENAFDFRHDNFELTLEKLIANGFRQDRKDQMIKALLKSLAEMEDDRYLEGNGIKYVTDLVMWLNDSDDKKAAVWLIDSIRDEAIEKFRNRNTTSRNIGLSEYFSNAMALTDIKDLCEKLGMDNRGSRSQLTGRLERWLKEKDYRPTREAFNAVLGEKLLELELSAEEMDADCDLPYEMLDQALPKYVDGLRPLVDQYHSDETNLSWVNRKKIEEMRYALLEWVELSVDPGEPLYKSVSAALIKEIVGETVGTFKGKKEEFLEILAAIYGVFDPDTQLPDLSATDQ